LAIIKKHMNKILSIFILFLSIPLNSLGQNTEFIAMEYVGAIGNRIIKVWLTDEKIFAAKVKGLTSETTVSPALNESALVVNYENRSNPNSYVNKQKESIYNAVNFNKITPSEFLNLDKNNFVIKKKDIAEFYHNSKKKWGMGGYPHNGRIFVISTPTEFNRKKKREFILVGNQDEKPILEWLKNSKELDNKH